MKHHVKIKDAHYIHDQNIVPVLVNVYGLHKYGLIRRMWNYTRIRNEAIELINGWTDNPIDETVPNHDIDSLTVGQVFKLRGEFTNNHNETWEQFYSHVARVCSVITRKKLFEQSLTSWSQSMQLYNSIRNGFEANQQKWSSLFQQQTIDDTDYNIIAGDKLDRFSNLTLVLSVCESFNITYDEAMDVMWGNAQGLILLKMTRDKIQHELSLLKENKMKAKSKFK